VSNHRRSSSRSKSAGTASRRCFRARSRWHSSSRRAHRKILHSPPPGVARGNASRRRPQKKRKRRRRGRWPHRCLLRPLLRGLNAPRSRRILSNMTTRSTRTRRETVTLRFFPLAHHHHHHHNQNRLVTPTSLHGLKKTNFFLSPDFTKRMKHVDRRLPSQKRRMRRRMTSLLLLHPRVRSSRSSSK
jgi:hypothetical protein